MPSFITCLGHGVLSQKYKCNRDMYIQVHGHMCVKPRGQVMFWSIIINLFFEIRPLKESDPHQWLGWLAASDL